jgi:hypothetical protein
MEGQLAHPSGEAQIGGDHSAIQCSVDRANLWTKSPETAVKEARPVPTASSRLRSFVGGRLIFGQFVRKFRWIFNLRQVGRHFVVRLRGNQNTSLENPLGRWCRCMPVAPTAQADPRNSSRKPALCVKHQAKQHLVKYCVIGRTLCTLSVINHAVIH